MTVAPPSSMLTAAAPPRPTGGILSPIQRLDSTHPLIKDNPKIKQIQAKLQAVDDAERQIMDRLAKVEADHQAAVTAALNAGELPPKAPRPG